MTDGYRRDDRDLDQSAQGTASLRLRAQAKYLEGLGTRTKS